MTCNLLARLAHDEHAGRDTSAEAIAFVRGRCPCADCHAFRSARRVRVPELLWCGWEAVRVDARARPLLVVRA